MRLVDTTFGKKPATRVVKIIFYVASLSVLPAFFDFRVLGVAWMNFAMPLILLNFLMMGLFSVFGSKEDLIDLWKAESRIGRELSDSTKKPDPIVGFRALGLCFIAAVLWISFNMIRYKQTYR